MSGPAIDRTAWRAQAAEAALDPALPIVDAHHHLWPEAPVPQMEPYDVEALLADKTGSGHNIVATVFVEAYTRYRSDGPPSLKPVGETEYIDQVGREADRRGGRAAGACAAIVAHADMMLGDAIEAVLVAHRDAAPERLRGIRHLVAHDPDYPGILPGSRPHLMAEPAFRAAAARLARHRLSLDIWLMHPQLGELAALAAACPETVFVLDHVGAPMGTGRYADGGADGFAEWRQGMARVAACPNVMLKLGGLNMELTGLGAPADAPAPWDSARLAEVQGRHILTAIDLFGPDRCMFESNFPVDRLSTNATILWNGFKRVAERFTPAEREALFCGTAARVYRIDLDRYRAAA